MSIPDRPAFALHAAFVLTGVVTTLLGPALPVLVAWWSLDDRQAGLLFAAQFVGSMLGSVLSSVGMTRVGFRLTLVAGIALMAAGVAGLGAGAHAIAILAIFAYGIGLGLTIPTTNLYVAHASQSNRASALSLLNLAWSAGAVAAPALVALFQRADSVRIFVFGLAASLLLMAAPIARLPDAARRAASPPSSGRRTRGALLCGALLFLYVGTETSVAGWVALYARRLDVISASLAVAMPSLFWAALLAGRAAAPIVLRRVSEARLLVGGLLVATAGVAALTGSRSAGILAISVAIGGLGLSTVFPLTLAQFTRDMQGAAAGAAGPVFVLAGLGGAVLPPLVGHVSETSGSLTAGLLVPLAGCVAMLAVLRVWQVRVAADAGA